MEGRMMSQEWEREGERRGWGRTWEIQKVAETNRLQSVRKM